MPAFRSFAGIPVLSSIRWLAVCVSLLMAVPYSPATLAAPAQPVQPTESSPDTTAETSAANQISAVENNLSKIPDRAAALYFLALAKQHFGKPREARELLRHCLAFREGFDPSGSPTLRSLLSAKDLRQKVSEVHANFPVVAHARVAFVTQDRDLVPEGLAYDSTHRRFYLSSLNRRTIVAIGEDGVTREFLRSEHADLLPILGIRPNPDDGTIWAASWTESTNSSELLHFDTNGGILGRYRPNDGAMHGFNDLIVRRDGEIILTDSVANEVFKFDPVGQKFIPMHTNRPLFYPNGITLGGADDQLFVADEFGILKLDVKGHNSQEIAAGPHHTVAGVDGLYWHNGSLIAVQNDIGSPRVVAFRLSQDGLRVLETIVLENRTAFTGTPTTGAIVGNDFYFIANSQGDNMSGDKIVDAARLEPVRIGVLRLP